MLRARAGRLRRAAVLAIMVAAACGGRRIAVDGSVTHQTWEGSGAMIAGWMEGADEHYLSERWLSLFADDLGLQVLRLDLLPTPLAPEGWDRAPVVRMSGDLDEDAARIDWTRSPRAHLGGEVAKALAARIPLRVLASVFSPPHWMKAGGNLHVPQYGGDTAGGTLVMTDDNLQQYARWMVASVVSLQRTYGVTIDALSIQNEPAFEEPYNSMQLAPEQYATALSRVAAEFSRAGVPMRFFGPEDVGYGAAGDHYIIDRQISYVRAVMDDPAAAAALHAVAVHGYGGDGIDSSGQAAPDKWRHYRDAIAGYGRPSWQTETGGGSPQWDGPGLAPGERGGPLLMAAVVLEAMHHGDVSMWLNFLLSYDVLDQHCLVGRDLDTDNPKYAVARQLFRWLRAGAVRLDVPAGEGGTVKLVVWRHPDGELTAIALNLGVSSQRVTIAFGADADGRVLRRYQTTRDGNHVDVGGIDGAAEVALVLPGESLTTVTDVR